MKALLALSRLPPAQAAAKLRDRVLRRVAARVLRRRDARAHSYGTASARLVRLAEAPDAAALPAAEEVLAVAALHLDHRWDLLGSGWVRVRHGMTCRGVEGVAYPAAPGPGADPAVRLNPANRDESRRIRALIPPGYTPVDWHLDFKSGFRWAEDEWYADVRFGSAPGADVKVPWELSRLQHLPQLALAYGLARAAHPAALAPAAYRDEFRSQALDWIAANPPRWGVNWASPMDVAIRAANLALAYDLFRAWGAEFDDAFAAELARSVVAHGRHLASNLEWDPRVRGNHYLADVLGLLFVGAYLPRGRSADAWLAFGVQELLAETDFQFLPDGANFEASTSYHRLSAEMVLLGSALVLGLPEEKRAALRSYSRLAHPWGPGLRPAPLAEHDVAEDGAGAFLSPEHVGRLAGMARFLVNVTKPGPRAHLVGDDDSGRFARLWPACDLVTTAVARARLATLDGFDELADGTLHPDARHADHRGTAAMAGALLRDAVVEAFSRGGEADGALARALARGRRLRAAAAAGLSCPAPDPAGAPAPPPQARVRVFPVDGGGLLHGLREVQYPDFGLYVVHTDRLYLAVRCGGTPCATGGHAHADQLALELCVDGADWIADPGSYLYTAFPGVRDRFRSVAVHFAPRVGDAEPVRLGPGPFRLEDHSRARCLGFGGGRFVGTHEGYGVAVFRRVEIFDGAVHVTDWSAAGEAPAHGTVAAGKLAGGGGVYADGYGRRVR